MMCKHMKALVQPNPPPNASTPTDYLNPEWRGEGVRGSWHNYVPHEILSIWESFNPTQRAMLARWGAEMASEDYPLGVATYLKANGVSE